VGRALAEALAVCADRGLEGAVVSWRDPSTAPTATPVPVPFALALPAALRSVSRPALLDEIAASLDQGTVAR
jgi:hypothetical protein